MTTAAKTSSTENFPVASLVLPKKYRSAVLAIYRFARTADEVADGQGDALSRQQQLEALSGQLDLMATTEQPVSANLHDLAEQIRQHQLDVSHLQDLLVTLSSDINRTQITDTNELLSYCQGSANSIGRLLLALFDLDNIANRKAADALCTGLQLIDFCQDIEQDWQRGKVYIPQTQLDYYQIERAQLPIALATSAGQALLRHECKRAQAILLDGQPLIKAAKQSSWRLGLEISAMLYGGLRVLEKLQTGNHPFSGQPVALDRRDKLLILMSTALSDAF